MHLDQGYRLLFISQRERSRKLVMYFRLNEFTRFVTNSEFLCTHSERRERARRLRLRLRGRRRAPLRRARAAAAAARRAALLGVRLRRLPAPPPPQQAQAQEAAAHRRAPHARRQAQEPRGLHHLPLGVSPQAPPGPRVLPALHQVDEPREGRLQAGGLEGRLPAVGAAQEQAGHELRDDGPGAPLLLPARHPRQSRRPAARVPVRGRAQGHRRDRLLSRVGSAVRVRQTLRNLQ